MDRIPIEERLARVRNGSGGHFIPDACRLYLDTYFHTLSEISGDSCYDDFYDRAASDGTYRSIEEYSVFSAAGEVMAGFIPEDAAIELLYQMLVKPFTDKRIYTPRGGKKK